jgi:hypothetical protein
VLTEECKAPAPRHVAITADLVQLTLDWRTAFELCAARLRQLANWNKAQAENLPN